MSLGSSYVPRPRAEIFELCFFSDLSFHFVRILPLIRKGKFGSHTKSGDPARTAIHVSESARILRELNNKAIDESSDKFYNYGG